MMSTVDAPNEGEGGEKIHILGIGNIGKLFAHSLARLEVPHQVTLVLHREALVDEFRNAGEMIDLQTKGISSKVEIPSYESLEPASVAPISRIDHLIVSTKATQTLSAIEKVKHRLGPESTILFAQNGMGTIDEVNAAIFPDPATRPNYLAAVLSHGLYSLGPFASVHAGLGWVKIATLTSTPARSPAPSPFLLYAILAAPTLNATAIPASELLYIQLDKLTMNAMINPLTAIFRIKNGELFPQPPILSLMRCLLAETSAVLLAYLDLPPEEQDRFGLERLETIVLDVAEKTGNNKSSMLQDVEAGKETEIDYINGWLVRKGEELGVEVGWNRKLVEMVKGGVIIGVDDIKQYFPDFAQI